MTTLVGVSNAGATGRPSGPMLTSTLELVHAPRRAATANAATSPRREFGAALVCWVWNFMLWDLSLEFLRVNASYRHAA